MGDSTCPLTPNSAIWLVLANGEWEDGHKQSSRRGSCPRSLLPLPLPWEQAQPNLLGKDMYEAEPSHPAVLAKARPDQITNQINIRQRSKPIHDQQTPWLTSRESQPFGILWLVAIWQKLTSTLAAGFLFSGLSRFTPPCPWKLPWFLLGFKASEDKSEE